jgi:hypothetical protein
MKSFSTGNCTRNTRFSKTAHRTVLALLFIGLLLPSGSRAQQPTEPANINPIDGETYYFINQLSGLQMDLDNGSTAAGVGPDSPAFGLLGNQQSLQRPLP